MEMAWLDALSDCQELGDGIKPGSFRVISYGRRINTKSYGKEKIYIYW